MIELLSFLLEIFTVVWAINIFIIVGTVCLFFYHKQLRTSRFRTRIIVISVLLLSGFNIVILSEINLLVKMLLIILFLFYTYLSYLASQGPVLHSKKKLMEYKKILAKGSLIEHGHLFDKKPFYLIDEVEINKWKLLKADYLIELNRLKDTYNIYHSIDEKVLLKKEITELNLKKTFLFYLSGDLNKAEHHLNQVDDESKPYYLMLKGMLEESKMNFIAASNYFQKALNITSENEESELQAMIYNNYGRLRFMENNLTDAITYYRKGFELSKKQISRGTVHIAAQNLIHTNLIKGNGPKASEYLQEYEALFEDKTLTDLREIFNLRIEIARHNGTKNEISKVIDEGYQEIRPLLTKKKQRVFDISILRMKFNSQTDFTDIMDCISKNLNEYFNLSMPEKYLTLKEINIPLQAMKLQFHPYHKYAYTHRLINKYMKTDALKDIDEYLSELKSFEVNERCAMELESVSIQKGWIKPYNFKRIYSTMEDVKDIYHKNGNHIEAIFMDLNIADECFAPENWSERAIQKIPKERMEKHVQLAADGLDRLNKYPRVAEGYIRLAVYYMVLNKRELAKKYFEAFEETNVPIHDFAYWIQNDYEGLRKEFSSV